MRLTTSLLIFLISISFVFSQEQLCTDLTEGTLCTSFTSHGCVLELDIQLNEDTLFHQNVTLYQLHDSNNQTYCVTTQYDCELCFLWEGTAIQDENAAQGCITLSGTCMTDTLYLGCFTDENVELCAKPSCPNNCSDNGYCQRDGVCNCYESFYGTDCSSQCTTGTRNLPKLSGTSYHSSSGSSDFLGYIKGDSNMAFVGILFSVQRSTDAAEMYISKSCYPSSDIYDAYVQLNAGSSNFIPLAANCQDVDGGYWYVRVVCSSYCSFSIAVREELISTLSPEHDRSVSISTPEQFYEFKTYKPGFTVEIYYDNGHLPHLTVSVMQSICPTDETYLVQLTSPNGEYFVNGIKMYKYTLGSQRAPPGKYFVRVRDPTFSWDSKPISNAYHISFSNSVCLPGTCQFGKCGNGGCECFHGFNGPYCEYHHDYHSPSSDHSSSSKSSDHDDHDEHHDHDKGLSGGEIAGIVIGSAGIGIFVVVVFVVVLATIVVRKRMNRNRPDTIYNLLSEEDTSSLM